jgi:transposase-like protein
MTERELERRAQRRLADLRHVEEVLGNVAATCRYYGISRQCYYGWLRRYEADGLEGLKDRSTPATPLAAADPGRGDREDRVAAQALPLRPRQDRDVPGPLPRPDDQQRPGHQPQVDVKFIEPLGQTGRRKKYYQFTAIDDCTRLRVLRAYPRWTRRPPSRSSTPKSSTDSSKAKSSTTPTCSPAAYKSGGTTTTTTGPRRPRRPNTRRAPPTESPRPTVIGLRQLHIICRGCRVNRVCRGVGCAC